MISSGDPFVVDGSNTPPAVRFAGSEPGTLLGDDVQSWAVMKGSCETVAARLENITYRRCGSPPFFGMDSVTFRHPRGSAFPSFVLGVGLSGDKGQAHLDKLAKVTSLSPASGPTAGGTEVVMVVSGLEI